MSSTQVLYRGLGVLVVALSLFGCGGGAGTPAPTITSVEPTSITVGDSAFNLVVSGTNFTASTQVYVGSAILSPTSWTPTALTVVVPPEAFPIAKVTQVTVTGATWAGVPFTIMNPAPTLTSLSLASVTTGGSDFTLDVTGTKFVFDTKLNFGGTTLIPSSVTPTALSVTVPATAIAKGRNLSITAENSGPGGGNSNGLDFTVTNPLPTLTSLSVSNIVTGSSDLALNIAGTNFVSDTTVNFRNLVLAPSSWTPSALEVTIPTSALSRGGMISLTATSPSPGGGTSNDLTFTISNPTPQLGQVSPAGVTAGGADVTITLTGSGFVPDSTLSLGETPIPYTFGSATQLTAVIPAQSISQAGTETLTVTNPQPGGGASNNLTFTIRPLASLMWGTVVNNKNVMPNSVKNFNSYSQPSVNATGLVVFKGQSKGSEGSGGSSDSSGPVRGIYTRRMGQANAPINIVADNSTPIPEPNNTLYNGALATFTQYPSFARIGRESDTVAFRGQHQPVYTYTLPDGTESRIGSAGVYSDPGGDLVTGIGLMGLVPEYSFFQVPGAAPGTRFDQFPGSPAVVSPVMIAFKGNYTEGDISKTGVFYRDLMANGGKSPVELIANTGTVIPNQPAGGTVTFGSTAPPSGANGYLVFTGWDNEDNPTLGGIYLAPITPNPPLQTLVGLGTQVPGEAEGTTFNQLGESLSFDGRYVAFWAAWGSETRTITLDCAKDGNKDRLADCNAQYPDGFQTQIPVHQGIFVYDMLSSQLTPIAKSPADFDGYLYWVFSGRASGTTHGGGEEGEDVVPEPPRWRSSAFMSVSGQPGGQFEIAFKARSGTVDGLFLAQGPTAAPIQTIVDTSMLGQGFDPQAPAAASVVSVGLERDSFRGDWFAFNCSMLDPATSAGLAGVYATRIPGPGLN